MEEFRCRAAYGDASDNRWDSDLIANEAEWSMTVDKAGVTDYICTYHPAMRAKLVVED